jgi:uncharacterized protein with von Willebrand factor type A (vWA) domain
MARHVYQEFDGSDFPTQEALRHFESFMEYVLAYGERAMDALRDAELDPEQRKIIEQWIEEGLLDRVGVKFRLTSRAVQSLQRRAMMEVFRGLKPDAPEGHESQASGAGGERSDGLRPYQFGDSASTVDMNATMRNAVARGGPGLPIRLREEDFEVHLTESKATCNTVILLDMSGSMGRWDRFPQAKRCAMAMHALIRQRYPLDTVDVVGFHSGAEVIPEHRLPLAMPKRVSMFDPEIRIRLPLDRIGEGPQHFTNLHMGLLMAGRILSRRGGRNKQLFIITDGEPTAHVEGGEVHLLYPPEESTAMATLTEALHLSRRGVRFSTFALIDDYGYMDWLTFVDHLTKLTRGVAFYTTSGELSHCVMESYLSGRRSKAFLT